jgi:hypothetical protein
MTHRRIVLALGALALGSFAPAAQAAPVLYGATGVDATDTSPPPVSSLYTIDPLTGVGKAVGPIGFSITGLAVDPSGTLYGATAGVEGAGTTRQLLTINTKTGAGTVVGSLGANEIEDIAFNAAGSLYGWNTLGDDLAFITRKPSVTAPTVGDSGAGLTFGGGIAFDKRGVLFGLLNGDDGNLWTINPATGAATKGRRLSGSPNTSGALLSAATFGCDRTTLYSVVNDYGDPPTYLVTINTQNGDITTRGQTVPRLDAIAFGGCPNDGLGPRVSLLSNARQRLSTLRSTGLKFKLSVDEGAKLEVRIQGRFTRARGGRAALRLLATKTVKRAEAKQVVTVTLKPSKALRQRLRREKRLPALLRVKATDESGSITTRTKTLVFR